MNKLLKRSVIVGLLSGVAMFGVGCQRSATSTEGMGGAGQETGTTGYGAPADMEQRDPATGGSGMEMEQESFERETFEEDQFRQEDQMPPPGTGGAGDDAGLEESRHDDSMMQPDAGMGGSGMEDESMQNDPMMDDRNMQDPNMQTQPQTDTESQPTY